MNLILNLYLNKKSKKIFNPIIWPLIIAFIIIILILRESWFCDDAFFTFRNSLNLHYGFGPVWNPGEKIQNYTNILWMFLISIANAQNIYLWTVILSIIFVIFTVICFFNIAKLSRNFRSLSLSLLILCFSWVYIDFGTSGLETPLSGFFIASTFYITRLISKNKTNSIFPIGLWVGLSYLVRPDLILITFLDSFLILSLKNVSNKNNFINIKKLFIFGSAIFLIIFCWLIFSTLYYGFPFPITAYTKLSTGISRLEILSKGISYGINFLFADIAGSFLIFLAFVIPFINNSSRSKNKNFFGKLNLEIINKYKTSIVIFSSIFYIIWIGGDFMIGRFFYPLLVYSACSFTFSNKNIFNFRKVNLTIISIAICLFSLWGNARIPYTLGLSCCAPEYSLTSFSHLKYGQELRGWGILNVAAHSKGFYAPYTYFFDSKFLRKSSNHLKKVYESNKSFYPKKEIISGWLPLLDKDLIKEVHGFASIATHLGPYTKAYDNIGLTNHMQSRMPVIEKTTWQPAHFEKVYFKLHANELINNDKDISILNKSFKIITQQKLLSPKRLREIFKQNIGYYNKNLNSVKSRFRKNNLDNCSKSIFKCDY